MKIDAYDTESLRKIVRSLQTENMELKAMLKKAKVPYVENNCFVETIEGLDDYDPDQGGRIINPETITDDMAKRFFSMFWGRQDVFARRGKYGGYYPQCKNRC